MSRFRGVRFARLGAAVVGALLGSAVTSTSAFANPARIRLKIESRPVKVGSTIPVVLEFLDKDFRPVKNDRDRTVRLDVLRDRQRERRPGTNRAELCEGSGGAFDTFRGSLHSWGAGDGARAGDIGRACSGRNGNTDRVRLVCAVATIFSRIARPRTEGVRASASHPRAVPLERQVDSPVFDQRRLSSPRQRRQLPGQNGPGSLNQVWPA